MNRRSGIAGAALLVVVLASCGTGGSDVVSPETEAAVVEAGAPAADALLRALVTRLTEAMEADGAVGAIEFCSTSAAELTAGVASRQGLDIKRTTLKYRNPANAPDQAETEALKHFESVLAETGELPASWVQRAGREEYRYYRPLVVAPPCLRCHGPPGEIDPAVRAILDERYPEDLATGYAVGDFRGLVRVSVPADEIAVSGG